MSLIQNILTTMFKLWAVKNSYILNFYFVLLFCREYSQHILSLANKVLIHSEILVISITTFNFNDCTIAILQHSSLFDSL